MKTPAFFKGAMLALLVSLFFSCQNNKLSDNSELIDFDRMNTYLNPESTIDIYFNEQPELFKSLSQKEKNGIVTLTPEVKGKLFLISKKEMVFQPKEPLMFGKQYKVTVHLDKLFNHADANQYTFNVTVRPLHAELFFNNLEPNVDDTSAGEKLTGRIHLSDNISTDKLKKITSAKLGNQSLPVSIEESDNSKTLKFTIHNIRRQNNDQQLIVTLNTKQFGAKTNIETSFTIPPSNLFSLITYDVIKKPEPHVVLTFSDPISTKQDLTGLIYFTDGTNIKLSIDKNKALIYPVNSVEGVHELVISKSITSTHGTMLNKAYSLKPAFKQVNPQVRFIGKGNILPGTDKWIIPFETVNLSAVDVVIFKIYSNNIRQFLQSNELGDNDSYSMNRVGEFIHHEKIILEKGVTKPDSKWKNWAIDLTKMIKAEPGAIYRVGFRFRKSYSILNCNLSKDEKQDFSDSLSYYYSSYYYPSEYRWEERDNPCKAAFYNYSHFPDKNFLAGNIGLTVKNNGNNSYKVFARNLITTDAISQAKIQFFSFQNQLLKETTTNNDGEATVTLDKEPFLVVAEWNGQYAYLRLQGGSSLSYSKFKTNGAKTQKGIKGYLFGERGVWRPGDTLHLTFVLQDIDKTLPEEYPVMIKIKDARDHEVYNNSSTSGINGFYVFNVPTNQKAPTGIWKAEVQIGNNKFTKNLRIETILPNRLKINLTSNNDRFVSGKTSKLYIESRWLHGGLASGLKANVTESISSAKTSFNGYEEFIFNDPAKRFYPDETSIFEGKLDDKGKASADVNLPEGKNLPGTLNLTFTAKVFEPGGRFSIEQKNFKYSPFKKYIGIEPPDKGNAYYYETDKPQEFKVVTLDDNGNKISVGNLRVEVYKIDWSWWYSSNGNMASYLSQHYLNKVFSTTIKTKKGEGSFSFTIKYPNWGRYFVRVMDDNSGNSAGTMMYFDWPSSYSRGNRKAPGDATLLSLTTDKESYQVGDVATISFPGSSNAKALISIEKNDKIIKSWWVNTSSDESSFKLEITKEMAPNVYAFVSVIQPHDQTVNDLPIRSYGVTPIMVNDPATVLHPVLTAPEKIKPESEYTIKVREADKRKMTYVLAIVDEGLLDLTHFKTPSLHDFFYRKESLSVKTWDLYDDVNGAFGARLSAVFAIGGDEDLQELSKKKINRFKPVVTFLGPFTVEKGSNGKTHHLKMSNYIGSVRVMVIAGNEGAYGKAEKAVPVKQPLMVLASLPRMLVPGETLNLPVTIFAMEKGIGKVTLNVSGNEFFTIDEPKQTLTFNEPGEKVAYVKLTVNNKTGIGKARLKVNSGNNTAEYKVEISIRNPNKRVYLTNSFTIEKGDKWKGKPMFPDHASDYKFTATVSKIPPINLESRIGYLIHYPYGCVEQTVSSVFPQLFLGKLTHLSDDQDANIESNIRNAIDRLQYFQRPSGGFSYWPGERGVSEWGTNYAGHFLILAKEAGYYVPSNLLNNWISYQQSKANNYVYNNTRYSYDFEQAYRLYTLALAGNPSYSAMNRLRTADNLSNAALLRLAAAYAIINEKNTAAALLQKADWSSTDDNNYWWYNYGSITRNKAMALETYVLMNDKTTAFEIFKEIANDLGSSQWMSTQTTAYALYAISTFVGNNEQNTGFSFNYQFNGKKEHVECTKPVFSLELPPEKDKTLSVKNSSNQTLFLNTETSAIPNPGKTVNKSQGLGLNVTYYDMSGKIIDPKKLTQGKDFYVKITVNKKTKRSVQNLALTAIFPSGWEILNTRMVDIGEGLYSSESEYQDIRDDRVNLFFDMDRINEKTFYILLNAAYPGNYFISPISCKAMYDNSINATLGGGMVEVIR